MTAEELRIGNYVSTGNGIAYSEDKVTSIETFVSEQFKIGFNNRVDVKYYCDDIQPIPLTEQWLLDFGFEKYYETVEYGINEELEGFKLGDWDIMQDVYGNWFMCGMEFNVNRFKHVHQLQNLYFALTGEELTIKEKV